MNGYYATEAEIVAIIRRLDVDADQKITYDEFIEAFRPQASVGDIHVSSLGASKYEEEKKFGGGSPLRRS